MIKKFLFLLLIIVASCREDEVVLPVTETAVTDTENGGYDGMYLLCEGNMGSNKCTIDFFDLRNQTYQKNIYGARNPNTVMELGDVGNDIQVYGSRLWIVVNCSNKVEVCRASDCTRIGQVNIPNCRYVAFSGRYAYVSSYVGPVQIAENAQIGRVYKVDTLTLDIVDQVEVGYQPEEMAIIGGKLYVANSGGYRTPNYDRTISVVDLSSFHVERSIDVAPNLHRLRADGHGQLWVSSRGDYNTQPSRLFWLAPDEAGNMQLKGSIDVPVSELCIVGDTLYYQGTAWSNATNSNIKVHGLINVKEHRELSSNLFGTNEIASMELPYGIIVNPVTKDFYLMDAKDYVSSGELLHFHADGTFHWRQWTGDIPSRAVFVKGAENAEAAYVPRTGGESAYIAAVDEYVPAPGQFVNMLPKYEEGDDATTMAQKCTDAIAGNKGSLVSLGAYGGYITFHFDHSVKNVEGEYDIYIKGNAFLDNSEPGIVMVSRDTNGNGLPDDDWYELSGSADVDSVGKVIYGYEITYTYSPLQNTLWTDSRGETGYVERNIFHMQEYYPLWLKDSELHFKGTLLPKNAFVNSYIRLKSLRYGYVDNLPQTDTEGCSFDIGWAVEPVTRTPVRLDYVDFIRVYCAVNQTCGDLGETSTEISGARDLHK